MIIMMTGMQVERPRSGLTVVTKVKVYKVEYDVHEMFNADRPHTVHVGVVGLWKTWRCDHSARTRQQIRATASRSVRERRPLCTRVHQVNYPASLQVINPFTADTVKALHFAILV